MKTIKTKKSVGNVYVLSYTLPDGKKLSNSNMDKEKLEQLRRNSTQCYYKCSEISEVELFEEVIEEKPDVGLAWIFFYKDLQGNIDYVTSLDERNAKFRRNTCKNNGFTCSAIREIKEEF